MNLSTCKQPGVLRYASLGDVHLGHHQTPTEHIIHNLDFYCTNETVLKDLDLLIITGDLFDRLLNNADDNVVLIQRWITRLLLKCSYLNVTLRVLEGTPSHDRQQSRFFVEQKANAKIPVDLHYATTLSIEYIEKFDLHVLYVPDKWRADTSETLAEVKTLLSRHQLTQVDFAVMHGAFEYQLPAMVPEPTHSSQEYLALVKYHILVGHVHFASQLERILAAGSYDRIAHAEEGAKGYYRVELREDGNARITFIENKGAKRYTTVDCRGLSVEAVYEKLQTLVSNLPEKSALRLWCYRTDPLVSELETIKHRYLGVQWTMKVDESEDKPSVVDVFQSMDLSSFIEITPHNVIDLLATDFQRHIVDPDTQQRCRQRLLELL